MNLKIGSMIHHHSEVREVSNYDDLHQFYSKKTVEVAT